MPEDRRRQLGPKTLLKRAVVAQKCRVLYLPSPKVASTAMLWLLAEAEDSPGARIRASVLGPTPALAIHDPVVHGLPFLDELGTGARADALTSARWIRLGLTRDPYRRLLSGWQHSVLLGTPGRLRFPLPDLVVDEQGNTDLGASFRAFVAFLDAHYDDVMANQHFMPQVEALHLDLVDYTDLARIDDLDRVLARLADHAPALSTPAFRVVNEGLGLDPGRCYDATTAAIVERRYASDFAQLGYDTVAPRVSDAPILLDALAGRILHAVHERNARIDMLRKGMGPRVELVRQRHAARSALRRLRARVHK